jgi:hypothetical protein
MKRKAEVPKTPESFFWAEFLPGIEKTIADARAALEAREQTLPAWAPTSLKEPGAALDERGKSIARLEAVAGQLQPELALVDALLQKGEEELRSYLGAVERLRHRLADWAGGAVG